MSRQYRFSDLPHLFRSVYTGTRADRKRALEDEDMRKVFSRLSKSSTIPSDLRRTKELFILMFLLRGLPFVDLAYLRKSDLRGNVITYRLLVIKADNFLEARIRQFFHVAADFDLRNDLSVFFMRDNLVDAAQDRRGFGGDHIFADAECVDLRVLHDQIVD